MLSISAPAFVIQLMTILNEGRKSTPHNDTKDVSIAMLKKYATKNMKTDDAAELLTLILPTFSGYSRLGSVVITRALFNCAIITCQRNILMEPLVEPLHPPVREKIMIAVDAKDPHCR